MEGSPCIGQRFIAEKDISVPVSNDLQSTDLRKKEIVTSSTEMTFVAQKMGFWVFYINDSSGKSKKHKGKYCWLNDEYFLSAIRISAFDESQ